MSSFVLVFSGAFVNNPKANKVDAVRKAIDAKECYNILSEATLQLSDEQSKFITIDDESFWQTPNLAYQITTESAVEELAEVLVSCKLGENKDFYIPTDVYFTQNLQSIFFPQSAGLEQCVILCTPPLDVKELSNFYDDLKGKQIFALHSQNIRQTDIAKIQNVVQIPESDEDTTYTVIVTEAFNCIFDIVSMRGPSDADIATKVAPLSWVATSQNKRNWYCTTDAQSSNDAISALFLNSLPTERTLALIKPTAVAKDFAPQIIHDIKAYGFTIVAQKQLQLQKQHAENFYEEHNGKPFFDELTTFMSSGPIYAFILEKIGAIRAWRTLLGPTNPAVAKETVPNSIRARFATDFTQNAAHGSDSAQSAAREVKFYFPEIAANLISTAGIVEEYMQQKVSSEESLQEFLIRGLSECARQKPGAGLEVVEWLGNWLLQNNPTQPEVEEPSDEIPTEALENEE